MSQLNDMPSSPQSRLDAPPNRPSPRFRPAFWLIIFGIVLPFAILQAPREIGRWHFANAFRCRAKDDPAAAYEALERARYWFPDSPQLLLQKAEWKLKDGEREEAIAVAGEAVAHSKNSITANYLRGEVLFNAGEFSKAVEDFKKVEEFSRRSGVPPLQDALNQLAYARALHKSDLDEALKNINEALELLPTAADKPGTQEHYVKGLFLDTRGYIYHLQGENEPAVKDLTEAIERVEAYLGIKAENAGEKVIPPALRGLIGTSSADTKARAAAVIRYHRSLALAALDRTAEAEKDRATARQLIGREPDDTLF